MSFNNSNKLNAKYYVQGLWIFQLRITHWSNESCPGAASKKAFILRYCNPHFKVVHPKIKEFLKVICQMHLRLSIQIPSWQKHNDFRATGQFATLPTLLRSYSQNNANQTELTVKFTLIGMEDCNRLKNKMTYPFRQPDIVIFSNCTYEQFLWNANAIRAKRLVHLILCVV